MFLLINDGLGCNGLYGCDGVWRIESTDNGVIGIGDSVVIVLLCCCLCIDW